MGQLDALTKFRATQQEYEDFRFGIIPCVLVNINRDPKKSSEYHWWEFMPRWTEKYKTQQRLQEQEQLKLWLLAKASADNMKVQ